MLHWNDRESGSDALFLNKYTLSVVVLGYGTWGWSVDTIPEHNWDDPQPWKYLDKGMAKTRELAKEAARAAASSLERTEIAKTVLFLELGVEADLRKLSLRPVPVPKGDIDKMLKILEEHIVTDGELMVFDSIPREED